MTQGNTGIVKSSTRTWDDRGRNVMRVIVDFYDGDMPDINIATIWNARPVTVTDTSINGEQAP